MRSGKGTIDEDALNIFTDGSSYPNKQRAAGAGVWFVWVNDLGDEVTDGYAPTGYEKATIDEMEIKACTIALQEAIRYLDKGHFTRILLFSDSLYVVDNFIKAVNVWPSRKWRGSNGQPVANIALWKELRKEVLRAPMQVDIEWVKAHKKNTHNKNADRLAKQSASIPYNKPLSISVTASKWSDRKTKRGCVTISENMEMKIRIISRKVVNKSELTDYRYEVIDPTDSNFKALDIARSHLVLSRHKCYTASFVLKNGVPHIDSIIEELDSSLYKYSN